MVVANLISPEQSKASAKLQVIVGLNQCIANGYTLTAMAHSIHWNLTGPEFVSIHGFLGSLYDSTFERIDIHAERIRALGAFVPTINLAALQQQANMPVLGEAPFVGGCRAALKVLIAAFEKNLADLEMLVVVSGAAGDLTTQNMIMADVEGCQKTLWMLRATVAE
jgi:starvation-inducible DNA-binding protein